MAKFRKKPVVIEAVRWRGFSHLGITEEPADQPFDISLDNMGAIKLANPVPDWLPRQLQKCMRGPNGSRCPTQPGEILRDDDFLMIGTLEGEMCAAPGDWIIRGVMGEIYPCKPDVFAATYEEA